LNKEERIKSIAKNYIEPIEKSQQEFNEEVDKIVFNIIKFMIDNDIKYFNLDRNQIKDHTPEVIKKVMGLYKSLFTDFFRVTETKYMETFNIYINKASIKDVKLSFIIRQLMVPVAALYKLSITLGNNFIDYIIYNFQNANNQPERSIQSSMMFSSLENLEKFTKNWFDPSKELNKDTFYMGMFNRLIELSNKNLSEILHEVFSMMVVLSSSQQVTLSFISGIVFINQILDLEISDEDKEFFSSIGDGDLPEEFKALINKNINFKNPCDTNVKNPFLENSGVSREGSNKKENSDQSISQGFFISPPPKRIQ
jgi:hypothetical protein